MVSGVEPPWKRSFDLKKGFTLLELAIASGILTVAILGLLASLQSPFTLNSASKETAAALQDASRVVEEIRVETFSTIPTTNWTTWAQTNGLTHRVNEVVTMTITGTDPLTVTVQVQWRCLGGKGPQRTLLLSTRRTS